MAPKKRIAWAMLGSMLVYGVAAVIAPSRGWGAGIDVVAAALCSFLIFAWYREDARERAFRRGKLQNTGVAAFALVGMPVYLFRTRGAWQGTLMLGWMLLFYVSLVFAMLLGSLFGWLFRSMLGMPMPGY